MAYFSRNGFIPVHGSITKLVSTGARANAEESVTVKDVKYVALAGPKKK